MGRIEPEASGTGSAANPIIAGTRVFHFANTSMFNSGGSDLYHCHYLHGRPGGEAYFNNVRLVGGRNCQQIKSTVPLLHVLNSYQSALAVPTNAGAIEPSTGQVYQRANNLIDPVNPADIQVYNFRLIGA